MSRFYLVPFAMRRERGSGSSSAIDICGGWQFSVRVKCDAALPFGMGVFAAWAAGNRATAHISPTPKRTARHLSHTCSNSNAQGGSGLGPTVSAQVANVGKLVHFSQTCSADSPIPLPPRFCIGPTTVSTELRMLISLLIFTNLWHKLSHSASQTALWMAWQIACQSSFTSGGSPSAVLHIDEVDESA